MAKIKNANNTNYQQGCRTSGTCIHCWQVCKEVHPLWKTIWQFFIKVNLLSHQKEYIWISSNEVDETGACYTEWSKPERKTPIQYTTEQLHFHFSLSCIGEGNGNTLQRSCLENPRDGGAWWAAVYGVAQSWTRLKRLSSSSNAFIWDQ